MCHTPTLRTRAEADYPALANQGNRRYGPSEANAAIDSYDALPVSEQQDLVNFLRAL